MATEQQRAAIRDHLARMWSPELAEAFMESYPPHRWDHLATKDDVRALRGDVDTVRTDVAALTTDVAVLTTDVAVLRADVAGFSIRLDEHEARAVLREDGMEHRITAEMRRLYVDQTRLLFFAMIGAIFTTATLAFAAVRF